MDTTVFSVTPLLAILVSAVGALLIVGTGERHVNLRESWSVAAGALQLVLVASMIPDVLAGRTPECVLFGILPGIELAFRGGTIVTGPITTTALSLDAYGEIPINGAGSVTFLNNDNKWKSSIDQIQGARFFQTRITFVSNADTSLSPTLSALGFAFRL